MAVFPTLRLILAQQGAYDPPSVRAMHRLRIAEHSRFVFLTWREIVLHLLLGPQGTDNPETEQLHLAVVGKKEVGWSEIDMDEALAVGVAQRPQNLLNGPPPFLAELGPWASQQVRWEFPEARLGRLGVVGSLYSWAWLEAGYRLGDWSEPCAILEMDDSEMVGLSVVSGPDSGGT